jgi:hypothetical protein
MTALGDRVHRVDLRGATRPRHPPRSLDEARTTALAALTPVADLFGLSADDLTRLSARPVRANVPPVAWELFGRIERTPRIGTDAVRLGGDKVVVDLDRRGAVLTLKVDWNLLPPVTLCDSRLDRVAVEAAVLGRRMTWTSSYGPRDEGAVQAGDIGRIERTAGVVRGSAYDADVTVGVVYAAHVRRNRLPWTLLVDPSSGDLIESIQEFLD